MKEKNILLPWKLLVLHIDKGLTAFSFQIPYLQGLCTSDVESL